MQDEQSILQLMRRLIPHINPRRRLQIGILLPLMIFASLAEVVSIGAVLPFLGMLTSPDLVFEHSLAQPLIHSLGLTEANDLLLPLTFLFGLAALFSGGLRFILVWYQTRLSHAIGADFSIKIYRSTLYQPYVVHAARNSSEVIAGITSKANDLVNGVIIPVLNMCSSLLFLSAILFALVVIEPAAFIAMLVAASLYALIILLTRSQLAKDSQCISRERNQVVKALQEGLNGIRDILIDGTQEVYCDVYRKADLPLRRSLANVQIISLSPRYGIEALGMVLIAALAYTLAGRPGGIVTAIPILGALALGAQRLIPVLQQIYASLAHMQAGKAPLADTLHLLEQPLPEYAKQKSTKKMPFQNEIALDSLEFQYPSASTPVLEGLSIKISKGARVGFVGPTGGGKSTLLDIIMGLQQPTKGALTIDGVPISEQNFRGWQMRIAHVPQAIFLADTSIAENIAFGVPIDQLDYSLIRSSAEKAQIAEAIGTLEKGYETIVGERGIRLSGGQRQRIGIARALYKQADVIVFDEATSALDSETELAVMQAIENLSEELTILIVAHRVSTLKNCDQIIELNKGVVSRVGTYAQVIGLQN